jgi:23S rRNA (adenine2503-C2)-methyltransferase
MNQIDLKTLDREGVFRLIESLGLPRYRADQLLLRLYDKYASDVDEITEFSKELRTILKSSSYVSNIKLIKRVQSHDNTEKFLFSLDDANTIESVLIPDEERMTICISSQIGCAMGCLFCQTARCGFVRNLKSHEILDQIIAVNRLIRPKRVSNVVLMGMGEPLSNFHEVIAALWRMVDLLGISKRKITLSTSGIVPKLLLLPRKGPEVNLAVSLNATTDDVRNRIMPVNKRYPIRSLMNACRKYPLSPGRRITFEYVMIDGVNDSLEDAYRLVKLLAGIRCKVNLIPLNPFPGCELNRASDDRIMVFQKILMLHKVRVLIRESRGRDIGAACGQLRAGYGTE